jgi:replicative DNA helicase
LLIDPRCAGEVFQKARREHFGFAPAQAVFLAAQELWNNRSPLDSVTVLHACGNSYAEYMADCMRNTPTAANVGEYLDIIANQSRLKVLKDAAMHILDADRAEDAEALYEQLGQLLRSRDTIEDLSWEECVSDYIDRMNDKTPVKTHKWGIAKLDEFLHARKGMFVILAADSSVGKTALALQFAYNMAQSGERVGFFSLETNSESLTDRLMAEKQVAGIDLPKTKAKNLSDRDIAKAMAAGMQSSKICLRMIRNANTIEQIRARTVMHNFDVIFIDYVQLISMAGRERWDIVTNISIQLHRMAQQLGVTVVGLSQITPPDKNSKKAPGKDDLRESRQLKHDADIIMMMSLSPEGAGEFRELGVVKNKDGPLGRMLLDFDAEHMSFSYRPPPKANPYAEINKAVKKAKRMEGQQSFTELSEAQTGPLPF